MRFFRKPETEGATQAQESGAATADGQPAPASQPPAGARRNRSLGETLVETGVISAEQLEQALAEQQRSGRKLGRVLTELGLCTQEDIATALQEQVRRIRIGDLLIDYGHITEEQLGEALKQQKGSERKLGQVLIDMGLVTQRQILEVLADQLQVPQIDLRRYQFDPKVAKQLPETLARRFRALPLSEGRDGILVAMADPTDIFAQDEIARALGQRPQIAVVAEDDLLATLDRVYRHTEAISRVAEELSEELSRSDYDLDQLVEAEMKVDAPVVRLLQTLFEDAVQTGASDIHIEPDEKILRVRQRIDGVLHEQEFKEHQIASALVSRLKIMAGLNISERRLPQDGRFNIRVRDRSIDVRVSTLPLQNGESVVMRLLDQSSGVLSLDKLGMPEHVLEPLRRLLRDPHGVILVTGPTGSGKTTTLYSALRELNVPGKKIITVEDPVEYRLPRVCQVQVNARIGLDFPRVLRTALRQDPDIVLVGEMRDQETAEIGVRAALTGHLVLSTLHTNDAISTPIRLLDMGVEGYLLAPSIIAVLAQRLARRVCPECAEPHTPDPRMLAAIEPLDDRPHEPPQWRRGTGCNRCNNTGVSGRIGIYELLEVDGDMASALRVNDHQRFADAARASHGFRPLGQVALDYARQGLIPLDEVLRIAGESAQLDEPDEQAPSVEPFADLPTLDDDPASGTPEDASPGTDAPAPDPPGARGAAADDELQLVPPDPRPDSD